MKLLFDHNISPKVARAINELVREGGSQAVPLRDKFKASTTSNGFHNLAKKADGASSQGIAPLRGTVRNGQHGYKPTSWVSSWSLLWPRLTH